MATSVRLTKASHSRFLISRFQLHWKNTGKPLIPGREAGRIDRKREILGRDRQTFAPRGAVIFR